MSDITRRLDTLTPKQRQLLLQRMRKKTADATQTAISPQKRETDRFPLSFAQERLWFLDQLEPESVSYNIPLALHLSGHFNVYALEQAFKQLVARHETLRTTFTLDQEQVVQVIANDATIWIPLFDLQALPSMQREQKMRHLARQEEQRPFHLHMGPLLRIQVVRLDKLEHVLLLTMHHIISDGWSIGILVHELSSLYHAFVQNQQIYLPALPIQYADYAYAQRQDWQQGLLQHHLDYWRQQLAETPDLIDLPLDRPRPLIQTTIGAKQSIRLSSQLSQELIALSQHEEVTLFMMLLATFQILLMRLSGQHDILVGTPIANRSRDELEGLIGFFINTLVLRVDLSGNPNFRELLRRVRQVALDGYAHQDLPFERLVEDLQIPRNLQHSPLVQVLFNMLNFPISKVELSGLTWSPLVIEETPAKFDLVMRVIENDTGLYIEAIYNIALFDPDTIERLLHHWSVLLESLAQNVDQRIEEVPLLTERERKQQILQWNPPIEQEVTGICIHQRFEQQVVRTPDALAVRCEQESLTYAELNQQANHLASFLRRAGVGPDIFVALCLERSLDLVIAVLAVLKAGGTYIPLDPSYPQERIAFILDETAPPIVLTQIHLLHLLTASSPEILTLDGDRSWTRSETNTNLPNETSPQNLAYMIYTSGSTGRPKGVQVSHANVVRLLQQTWDKFRFDSLDVWTLFHTYAFDVSVWELWGALLYGGLLVVVPYKISRSPDEMLSLLQRERVSILCQTPSAFRQLIQEQKRQPGLYLKHLRSVIFAGEALDLASLRPWCEHYGDEQPELINMYGITETTVHTTYRRIRLGDIDANVGSLIGQAIPDMEIYILDAMGQIVPTGVTGELYVGGAGLARGYWQRPELTAERFLPHPFSNERGARLYRSGDLVRWRKEGELEYLGRSDDQIKLRGFRIELGEIEAALKQHPTVNTCVVLLREDTMGEHELVAYLILHPKQTLDIKEARQTVATLLPSYMVPARWVFLETFPLNLSGKIDRRALLALTAMQSQSSSVSVLPRTPLETELALMWQTQLQIEQVDIYDSFFELGGDSIKAAIFINRLQDQLRDILHVITIFDHPTIASLADYLTAEHPKAIERVFGANAHRQIITDTPRTKQQINATMLEQFRSLISPLPPLSVSQQRTTKNPPAIFILAPPRSGTTLLRVMLAGHPQLFAPPELELLSFNTLQERHQAYQGRDSFWLEGTLRALIEIKDWDVATVRTFMEQCEQQNLTTQDLYAYMQDSLEERILVDKTPAYALDPTILRRAEEIFEQPYYIHLIRHPYGMIRSFEEARLDQIFFRYPHTFDTRELAELVWLLSQQNIRSFLQTIPTERQIAIHYEALVDHPEQIMREFCEQLHIAFHPDMLQPYQGQRMTDGIHAASRMLGDVKFHQHQGIDTKAADQWKQSYSEDFLGDITWQEAEILGYPHEKFGQGQQADQRDRPPTEQKLQQIERHPRQESLAFPLSFAQERLWILDQLNMSSTTYSIPTVLRLHGALSVHMLQRSFAAIIERHEILRTTFHLREGKPVQVIAAKLPLSLPIIDLEAYSGEKQEHLGRSIAQQGIQCPFDLSNGPLLRVCLLRFSKQEHILICTIHHIVTDGWSMGIMMYELTTLYQTLQYGKTALLPELPIQYADYARWQRQFLQGEVLQEQLAYWQRQLQNAPASLNLPMDHPRPAIQAYLGAEQSSLLPAHTLQALKTLGMQEGTTLFMTFLAAFYVLLMRYSGQEDILVGTPIANRTRKEVEGLIGFFVNTLVLRINLHSDPSFRQLLAQVREVTLGAYKHQDLPFEKLVEELQPERSLSYSPLFQVLFSLQNTPQAEIYPDEAISWQYVDLEQTTAKFDLSCALRELDQGLATVIEYNTAIFDNATIVRLLEHWQTLLQGVVANPNQAISTLPLLTSGEQQILLHDWNTNAQAAHQDSTISQLFTQQAIAAPDRIAIMSEQQQLSYGELQRRANQLAWYLRTEGCGPETHIGICLENTCEIATAILAILKVGGAYVPLDPSYPTERLAYMIQDAQMTIILTQQHLQKRLPSTMITTLWIDDEEIIPDNISSENLDTPVLPDNLLYLIYTSGSTGKPKGTGVSYRGFSNMLNWFLKDCTIDAQTNTLVLTSFSFDLTQKNLFAPLLVGGTVTLLPSGYYDPQFVCNAIAQYAVTFINCPSGMFYPLVESDQIHDFSSLVSLRGVFLGAETLTMPRLLSWLNAAQCHAHLFNSYGPTECTDIVCFERIKHLDHLLDRVIPVGRPITNTQVYILDTRNNPVPIGVAGELYVGGDGVARGYIGLPDVTAERFVPHPFHTEPGARLYKTGDIVRYRFDGRIEFVGRSDSQVKLRGFRIELGEIEAVLWSHPAVLDAVAIVHEESDTEKSLVAYLLTQNGAQPTRKELREHIGKRLPGYMIPSIFVTLDTFPLTANGKVDRLALARMPLTGILQNEGRVAPHNSVEQRLLSIWQDLLHIEQIGIHDNFFEAGGHSLLAVLLLDRVNQQFRCKLSLTTFFQAPTIAQIAALITQTEKGLQPQSLLVPLQQEGENAPFFSVHPASGYANDFTILAQHLQHNRPFYGIQAPGLDSEQETPSSVEEMATMYITAIRSRQPEGPYYLGGYSSGGLVAFEMARQLQKQGETVALLALFDTFPPLLTLEESAIPKIEQDYAPTILHMVEVLKQTTGKLLPIAYEDMLHLQPEEQLAYLLKHLKTSEIIPQSTELFQLRASLQAMQAILYGSRIYRLKPYTGKITLFLSEESSSHTHVATWQQYVSNPIETYLIPGTHQLMMQMPYVATLVTHLQQSLDTSRRDE